MINKFFKKLKNYLYKNIFNYLKYSFEEFIPNSKSNLQTTNNLIRINIKNLTKNLLQISEYFSPVEISNLDSLSTEQKVEEELKNLFDKFNSDKSSHGYHKLYASIFNEISESPTILEIGIGSIDTSIPSNMGKNGTPGASLRAFSEMYPNSDIYGADIDIEILKDFEQVKTFYLDQNNLKTFDNPVIQNKKFDIIIDDGLHMQSANLNSVFFAIQRLKTPGVLVVEDVSFNALDTWKILTNILEKPYSLQIVKCLNNFAVVLRNF